MLGNQEFVKLINRTLFFGDKEIIDQDEEKKIIDVLSNLLTYEDDEVETDKFLINYGVIIFFLHTLFEKSAPKQIRQDILRLIKLKFEDLKVNIGAFMPI